MAENLPNLKKENRYRSTGRTEGSKQDEPERPKPRCIIIKMAKVKDKKRTL